MVYCYIDFTVTFEVRIMKKSKLEKCIRTADLGDNAASTFANYGVEKKKRRKI